MRSRRLAILLLAALAGCGPRALGRAALRHDDRAAKLAPLGEGVAAAHERQRAEDLRASARVRSAKLYGWFWTDVLLN